MNARARRLVVPAAIALSAALLPVGCKRDTEEDVPTSDVVSVSAVAVRRGTVREVVDANGLVAPQPGAEMDVAPPQAARIESLPVGIGDRVRPGEVLVRFDVPSLEADIAAREADGLRAAARETNAKAALDRVSGLFDRGIAARKEVEDAQREMADAEAAVSEAQGALAAARAMDARRTVRARFAGVVISRSHDPGDLVDPGSPDPILRVIDPERLEVVSSVPVDALHGLAEGTPARIIGPPSYAAEDARLVGRPAAVDPKTSTATVRLAFTRATALPAGTTVRVEIAAREHRDVLVIPAGAIVRENGSTCVFTVGADGKAHRRPVTLGIAGVDEAEVASGLAPGDRVVAEGAAGLPDGATVAVRE